MVKVTELYTELQSPVLEGEREGDPPDGGLTINSLLWVPRDP